MRARLAPLLAVLLLGALFPGLASGSAYSRIVQVYAASGTVSACRFSSAELEAALREAPTYDVEYFGDFTNAIRAALAERAAGVCAAHRPSLSAKAASGLLGSPPAAPAAPGSATAATGATLPLPLLLAACLLGLACLAAAAVGAVRVTGWDPAWMRGARHSWREAEYRLGGRMAGARDRLRL